MPGAAKRNSWKRWTDEDLQQLRALAQQDVPKEIIGLRMGRTADAVAQRAWLEGIALAGRQTRSQRVAVRQLLHASAQGVVTAAVRNSQARDAPPAAAPAG